ncbi:hypothetical protein HJFPF1_10172 [Paramyrothecium foliicola]|nr:hypothetical protein HJFPF1_10172 [Paramyrothecium foliicola]
MVRSASAEPVKPSKRKAETTRDVWGVFFPPDVVVTFLARKRANDREAQRAIRARTKEHIERLERELEDLKSNQNRDKTVQELLRRNKALEEELFRIKETVGVSITSSPYQSAGMNCSPPSLLPPSPADMAPLPSVYDDNLSTGTGAVHSPRSSPFPQADYSPLPDYSPQSYVPLPSSCEPWTSQVVSSTVSSPTSSAANPEEYGAPAYIPTSVPSSMLPSNNSSSSNVTLSSTKSVKNEFDDVASNDAFPVSNPPMPSSIPSTYIQQSQPHHQQQPWNMYPMYYPQLQSPVH